MWPSMTQSRSHWPLYASYFIACALLLWRRTTGSIMLPDEVVQIDSKEYNLTGSAGKLICGRWRVKGLLGGLINAFACVYLLIIWIFVFWLPTKEVAPSSMSYSSLVMGAVAIFSTVYYVFWGRRTYHGAVVDKVLQSSFPDSNPPTSSGQRRDPPVPRSL